MYTVKRQQGSKQYGIYNERGELVEGGFFSRFAAEVLCDEYNSTTSVEDEK